METIESDDSLTQTPSVFKPIHISVEKSDLARSAANRPDAFPRNYRSSYEGSRPASVIDYNLWMPRDIDFEDFLDHHEQYGQFRREMQRNVHPPPPPLPVSSSFTPDPREVVPSGATPLLPKLFEDQKLEELNCPKAKENEIERQEYIMEWFDGCVQKELLNSSDIGKMLDILPSDDGKDDGVESTKSIKHY
ncbi:unnamed protein product [Ceutorhynchus assimilis]|uniref:Uncharacterized protein n=1 Tax=Ceutorhynchus assimilis TaxID=467358 RepID=A0A9N9MBR8_9CUCU|nr:unnamed protein product [Ceutorhynchus assimilis]